MSGCNHVAGRNSSLQVLQVKSVVKKHQWRYAVACTVCGRMTNWFRTILEAKLEAYYGCWMEER